MQKKIKPKGLDKLKQRYGYIFVGHWIFGLIVFFFAPLVSSILYSFSEISIGIKGITTDFIGIGNFKQIINEDPNYLNNLRDALGSIFYSLPIIVSLSLILAVVLNQKFVGRTLARAIFFLPVIIASSVIMEHMSGPYVSASLFTVSSGDTNTYGGLIDFTAILADLNFPTQVNDMLESLLGNVFGLIWSCGVQTILFLSGKSVEKKRMQKLYRKIKGKSRTHDG